MGKLWPILQLVDALPVAKIAKRSNFGQARKRYHLLCNTDKDYGWVRAGLGLWLGPGLGWRMGQSAANTASADALVVEKLAYRQTAANPAIG